VRLQLEFSWIAPFLEIKIISAHHYFFCACPEVAAHLLKYPYTAYFHRALNPSAGAIVIDHPAGKTPFVGGFFNTDAIRITLQISTRYVHYILIYGNFQVYEIY
jgi:hypothetical protein